MNSSLVFCGEYRRIKVSELSRKWHFQNYYSPNDCPCNKIPIFNVPEFVIWSLWLNMVVKLGKVTWKCWCS
jgi:hypothetical protein